MRLVLGLVGSGYLVLGDDRICFVGKVSWNLGESLGRFRHTLTLADLVPSREDSMMSLADPVDST